VWCSRLLGPVAFVVLAASCGGSQGGAGPQDAAGGGGGASGSAGAAGEGGGPGGGGGSGHAGIGGSGGGIGGASGIGGAGGATGAGGSSPGDAGWDAPPLGSMVTIHVAGDSTAAVFPPTDPTMRVGWAAVLDPLFDSTAMVNDAALSGRSSKSFIDEGAWAALQAQIQPGDYLFVEFAHNDEKSEDPTRYTIPATTYREYLRTYIDGARARGGFPVLLTSICRRQFNGNTVTATHGAYTTAMFAVGQETGTPVIDMEKRTKDWLMALGPTNSVPMFATGDNTHLSMQGAVEVARLAVAGIRALGLPLAARALP
jgi:lysophospholipase L1-like esterase